LLQGLEFYSPAFFFYIPRNSLTDYLLRLFQAISKLSDYKLRLSQVTSKLMDYILLLSQATSKPTEAYEFIMVKLLFFIIPFVYSRLIIFKLHYI